ncbi:MAG: hypothetical protein K7J15_06500, partial [Candidatus Regiella insecticola]|nr:hypothetical protein [Candidatus Regiella insecticola]
IACIKQVVQVDRLGSSHALKRERERERERERDFGRFQICIQMAKLFKYSMPWIDFYVLI